MSKGPAIVLSWIERYVFSVAVLVTVPVIVVVMLPDLSAMTPDGRVSAVQEDVSERPAGWICSLCSSQCDDSASEALASRLPTLSTLEFTFEWQAPDARDPEITPRSMPQILADDVAARYRFAVPISILMLVSIPGAAIALVGLFRVGGLGWTVPGVALLTLIGFAAFCFRDPHPLRTFTAEYLLLRAAEDPGYGFMTRATWDFTFRIIDVATTVAVVACAALMLLFARLAVRSGAVEIGKTELIERAVWFRTSLIIGSITLALAVAATYGLMHWSSSLVIEEQREPLSRLSSSAALSWGVLFSLTLVMFAAPTYAAIRFGVARAGGIEGETVSEGAGLPPLLDEVGLNVSLGRLISTLLTLAAPAFTGPALDLLNSLSGL